MRDEGEDIEVIEMPLTEAMALVESGGIIDAKTVMLIQYAVLKGLGTAVDLLAGSAYVHRNSTMNQEAHFEQLVTGLNQSCLCVVLRPGEIGASFLDGAGSLLPDNLEKTHPHLFAHTPVYMTEADLAPMLSFVSAMERIAALPGWLHRATMQKLRPRSMASSWAMTFI